MSDKHWEDLKRAHYRKELIVSFYAGGNVFFSPSAKNDVRNLPPHTSYDDFLEIQKQGCHLARKYFEQCYIECGDACFLGKIQKVDKQKGKILFNQIAIDGSYRDGSGFFGAEDHVWMDIDGFEDFSPGDAVCFRADVYRYYKVHEKRIDYALENPSSIEKIDGYEIPSKDTLINEQIKALVCETCRNSEQCYGNCIANQDEIQARFDLLKSFQKGKFTPLTVQLAYELEYRMYAQLGGIKMPPKDSPAYEPMRKFVEICESTPCYYIGDVKEAICKMAYPEKPRIYIE